jgi:hypothetical protein
MAEPSPARTDRTQLAIGALTAATGLYFVLVGLHALPPPSRSHAPAWIVVLCGLVFLAGGLAVVARGAAGMNDQQRDMPESAPFWARVIYWLAPVVAAGGLAAIGTWVAFGPGERHFSISGPIAGPLGDDIGRVVFGLGAILTWLLVAALARAGAKKLFGGKS